MNTIISGLIGLTCGVITAEMHNFFPGILLFVVLMILHITLIRKGIYDMKDKEG